MKKIILLIVCLICLFSFCVVNAGNNPPTSDTTLPYKSSRTRIYNYTYTGYKIEFDGCVGYMEGSNNGVLLYYGDYSEMGPESGPMMTTWDVNTGRVRHADGVDISEYKIGDEVTAVVTLLPYKNGSGMYSVELQEIKHR